MGFGVSARRTMLLGAAVAGMAIPASESSAQERWLFHSDWGAASETSIERLVLPGGAQNTLLAGSPGNSGPTPHNFGPGGLAADPANQYVYFANPNDQSISRINFDGTGRTPIVTGVALAQDVALDLAAGKIYWCDSAADVIRRADLNGQNVETIVSTGLLLPSGLAIDAENGRLYWADYHADVIGSINLDGTNRTQFATPADGPKDVAIDPVNDKVLWTDFDDGRIHRANLNGTGAAVLIPGAWSVNFPDSIAVDPVGGHLYWTDRNLDTIRRADLADGGNAITVLSKPGVTALPGLAVVPEPSTTALCAAGAAGLLARRRRR